jgi:predicted nucleic-acid-binding Zn-ribbon protein
LNQRIMCEVCGNREADQIHHKMSQNKLNKMLYPEYIHDKRNLVNCCQNCHLWKTIPKWNEKEFAAAMGIEPRSKTAKFQAMLNQQSLF